MYARLPIAALLLAVLPPTGLPVLRGTTLQDEASAALRARVARGHAAFAHDIYTQCEERTRTLEKAIRVFVAGPSHETHLAAKDAWLAARELYGRSEVLRFSDGPIDNARDGVETLLNAWPLDEAYIDGVAGDPGAGIIQHPAQYPYINGTLLSLLNERGGEANVAVGWHAVEFLLWGQDLDEAGPGSRTYHDYLPEETAYAGRRGQYLLNCAELLVQHHRQLTQAWALGADTYRAAWLARPADEALQAALTGMLVLSGFEMSGERLAVAYETKDQEEEHSCFSDNTHVDFIANQEGILAVYRGEAGGGAGPGVRAVARELVPELAAQIDEHLDGALAALRAMPVPFDQAVQGSDDGPGRRAVLGALEALERQAGSLSTLALALGFEIAIQPGG